MAAHTTYKSTSWLKGSQLLLEYDIRLPLIDRDTSPLVLMLHGVGSNEKDLFRLADQFGPEYTVVSARAPFQLGPKAFGWYAVDFSTGQPVYDREQAAKSKLLIVQFVNQLLERYTIDRNQVYLMGFSQGAIMSYSVGIGYPRKFKGILAFNGRMLVEDQELLKRKNRLDLRVFISHSLNDSVLPYSHALEAHQLLNDRVAHLEFSRHDKGHTIDSAAFGPAVQWMLE